MRTIRTTLAAFGLAALSVTVPLSTTPSASAGTAQFAGCNNEYNGQGGYEGDGKVHIYRDINCANQIGNDIDNDSDWGDGGGDVKNATNMASSVLNSGIRGGYDAVAFYDYTAYSWEYGFTCLKWSEFYADDLTDNRFSKRTKGEDTGKAFIVNDAISSHKWVPESACGGTFVD